MSIEEARVYRGKIEELAEGIEVRDTAGDEVAEGVWISRQGSCAAVYL